MSIWNLLFSDKSDESYTGNSISISSKTPTGYTEDRGGGGLTMPKNMAGCLFYLILIILGMWALTDYSRSLDEPDRVRICDSASILPWRRC